MKNIKLLIMVGILAITVFSASAADLTADEIVSKANQASYYAGKDGSAKAHMELSDGRTRDFVILRKNTENSADQKFYVYFNGPADVRKMAYLVWKKPSGDDDRWLFLPALNLVKRIAPGDKRTSFVGSDFYYEDVSGRGLDADMHELIETTDTQYVVKNVPRDPSTVEFSSYTVWIDKDTFLPRQAEYTDAGGVVYRRLTADDIQIIQGYATSMKQKAEDIKTGSSTVITFSEISYDQGFQDQIFTERFLRRPPREATR
ncbi:outer membrane lipoprotein-sorting protein [bacterium]|nr:outer membrane lipoprotein-sorting protein [candidate division CSSED10-310 bacterium]